MRTDQRTVLGWGIACLLPALVLAVEQVNFGAAAPAVQLPGYAAAATSASAPTVPLAALQGYSAVVERPLFTQSRRPPSAAAAAAQPGVPAALSLAGIMISGSERIALVRQGTERKLTRVREGQAIGDWTIRSIADDRITLGGPGEDTTLSLQTRAAAKR